MKPLTITDDNFKQEVLDAKGDLLTSGHLACTLPNDRPNN